MYVYLNEFPIQFFPACNLVCWECFPRCDGGLKCFARHITCSFKKGKLACILGKNNQTNASLLTKQSSTNVQQSRDAIFLITLTSQEQLICNGTFILKSTIGIISQHGWRGIGRPSLRFILSDDTCVGLLLRDGHLEPLHEVPKGTLFELLVLIQPAPSWASEEGRVPVGPVERLAELHSNVILPRCPNISRSGRETQKERRARSRDSLLDDAPLVHLIDAA